MNLSSATSSLSSGCAHSDEQSISLIGRSADGDDTAALRSGSLVDSRVVSAVVTWACVALVLFAYAEDLCRGFGPFVASLRTR